MVAPNAQVQLQTLPLAMAGGCHFGRFSKISNEKTVNFIVSDGWLCPYAGYANILNLASAAMGRGIYTSYVGNFMIVVIGTNIFKVFNANLPTFSSELIGSMFTNTGDVYIAENNNRQIIMTDGLFVYVYNYNSPIPVTTPPQFEFMTSNPASINSFSFPFANPGYVSFQGGQLIIAVGGTNNWVLSDYNQATVWSATSPFVGAIQSKPDFCQAVVPIPGGGQNILVFGRNVVEMWQRSAQVLFPFIRQNSFNIDFGCISPASIAALKDYVVWISVNEQSGPVVMRYEGGRVESISTDGIDYQLSNLSNPTNCTGFLYQQDGHVLYQFTFIDDNLSYAYDFETKLFFNVTDENLNYHIAREVVYFNNEYYFVSLNGGNVYNFDTRYTFAQYTVPTDPNPSIFVIPRIRICPPLRLPSQRYFVMKEIAFTIENGEPNPYFMLGNPPVIYSTDNISLAISRDGGETWGSFWRKQMNPTGGYISRMDFLRCGHANDASIQLYFTGYNRFLACDGTVEFYE